MRVTVDKAGRVVIPKRIRDEIGLPSGAEVEISVDGVSVRIEPLTGDGGFVNEGGIMVIPATGTAVTDEQVRELRLADQA